VEVWTRFMRIAHQGVPVAAMPNSRGVGGFLSNLFQTSAQTSVAPVQTPSPIPARPIPSDNGYRPPVARASVPPSNPNARPEPAAGLDGWLVDRLFGGNR
jgi:penicillin-binding protein 1A